MSEWIITPFDVTRDLDEVAALDALCFTNPTTREMFRRETEISDVAHLYVLRLAVRPASSPQSAEPAEPAAPAEGAVLADVAGPLLAYCAVWLIFDELHINTLAVHPDWRRRGLASILLRHVLADAARQGADKATLEVRRSNEAAQRLYAGFGFTIGGTRPAYYRHPVEDALILWRTGLDGPPRPAPDPASPPPNGLA